MSTKNDRVDALIKLCTLSRLCFRKSKLLNKKEINSWLLLIEYIEEILKRPKNEQKLNAYQTSSIEGELLKYWNNYLNIEVEQFWQKIQKEKLPFKRKATFESIIEKNRFKNVEQAIDIYNDIYNRPIEHFDNPTLKLKLGKLYEVIQKDRNKRLEQFRKWIKNQRVSKSDRGKFGENYAYMKRTGQFDEVFGKNEKKIVEELAKR